MAIALIYDHVGTNPIVISECLSTHIYHERNQSSHHDRMAMELITFPWRKPPLSGEHQASPKALKLHPSQWIRQ